MKRIGFDTCTFNLNYSNSTFPLPINQNSLLMASFIWNSQEIVLIWVRQVFSFLLLNYFLIILNVHIKGNKKTLRENEIGWI